MLFYSTIDPATLQLLRDIQRIKGVGNYILVGGTSLALQIGHRTSVDLDLFSFSGDDISIIPDLIFDLGRIQIVNQSSQILNLFINDIKVDFVSYRYALIKPVLMLDDIKLASVEDIAAMKLAAITGRGSRKDFVDLFFILEKYTLPQLFDFYRQLYPDGSEFQVLKSLVYFDDAEIEPMPVMIKPVLWEEVKAKIIVEVNQHFS